MLIRTLVVGALAIALGTAAVQAQDAKGGPTDDCMKSAYDLADSAESKQLPDATLEKLDGMFNTMEKHCKALELAEAKTVAAQIKVLIEAEK